MSDRAAPATPPSSIPPAALPRLRADLRVAVDSDGGFIIEDPTRTQFFRVGKAEYRILSYLDGRTNLATAAQKAAQSAPDTAVSAERLPALAQWLAASNLLEGPGSPGRPSAEPAAPANPCYFRVPLTAGGPALARLTAWCGWIFSWPAAGLVLVLSWMALFAVVSHWTAFSASLGRVFYPDQHLVLAICWLALKVMHELGHGIACKRFGGEVREFGLAMVYFMPVPYTDVTASWRCSRWERIVIASAGIYVEWIVALGAIAVWTWSTNPAIRNVCVYLVSLATLTTIVFNANPLCRLDGYYVLSDLLGRPNLSAQGQRLAMAWLSWLFTGQPLPQRDLSRRDYLLTGCYGLAAKTWQTLSLVTMAVVVLLVYEGFGLLMLLSIVAAWKLQTSKRSPLASPQPGATWLRGSSLLRLGVLAAALFALGHFAPWPGGVSVPGTVENVDRQVVRAPCAGEIIEILVTSGQQVAAGQEIALMRNDELALELAELEFAYAQGEVKLRSQRIKKQLVDFQVEERRQQALAERIADHRQKLTDLTVKAPSAGRVVARRLIDLPGSFIAEGAEICSIATDDLEFRILVGQRDVPAYATQLGQPVAIVLPHQTSPGILKALEPQASSSLGELNLGATSGGPLAVTAAEPQSGSEEGGAAWKLTEPRVTGRVQLPPASENSLRVGQRGVARIHPANYTVGSRLSALAGNWFQKVSAQSQNRTSAK